MATIEDIGIDLGSTNVLIYAKDRGIVLNEPAMLAFDYDARNVIAIGTDAYKILGREPSHIEVVRPLQSAVIRDFDMLSIMLNHFITLVIGKRIFSRPRAVLSISCMANELEKRQLILGMLEAGARRTTLLPRPLAAAIGAGINVMPHVGHLVVDIGGANTHAAAIASGEIMAESAEIDGGDAFTDAIIRYVRLKYSLLIGFKTAEDVKCAVGNLKEIGETEVTIPVAGRSLVTGLPKQISLSPSEVTEALNEPKRNFIEALIGVIEHLPAQLANDVFDNGIVLTGGGANLKGLRQVMEEELRAPCFVADHPQEAVAAGCGYVLERPQELSMFLGDKRNK
ncbi:MAG: rod shape-determining protein [Christensenellales bacterium]|jgi:rod shape-determining protein MreB|nr:rod shape-determining protein [Christensenellaceae bacterium]